MRRGYKREGIHLRSLLSPYISFDDCDGPRLDLNDVRSCIDAFQAKPCVTAIERLGVVVLLVHDSDKNGRYV